MKKNLKSPNQESVIGAATEVNPLHPTTEVVSSHEQADRRLARVGSPIGTAEDQSARWLSRSAWRSTVTYGDKQINPKEKTLHNKKKKIKTL